MNSNSVLFKNLAQGAFFVSVVLHFIGLMKMYVPDFFDVLFLVMHVGMFVVFVPAIFKINRLQGAKFGEKKKVLRFTQKQYLKFMKTNRPKYFLVVGIFLMVYAVINFFLFVSTGEGGGPHITENGQYVIQNHGDLIRVITEKEYWELKANELRGFSGFWMLFYFVSFMIHFKPDTEILDLYPDPEEL